MSSGAFSRFLILIFNLPLFETMRNIRLKRQVIACLILIIGFFSSFQSANAILPISLRFENGHFEIAQTDNNFNNSKIDANLVASKYLQILPIQWRKNFKIERFVQWLKKNSEVINTKYSKEFELRLKDVALSQGGRFYGKDGMIVIEVPDSVSYYDSLFKQSGDQDLIRNLFLSRFWKTTRRKVNQ
jgi:hypothetical protein